MKAFKIILIAIVVIGIAFFAFYYAKILGNSDTAPIAVTSFEKSIQSLTDSKIKGKDFASAQSGFQSIMQEIDTEASITLAGGEKNLKDEEVNKARKIVFYEYAPIFIKYGIGYFENSYWDESSLNSMRKEALTLQNMKLIESGTNMSSDLNKIVSTINDYFEAWRIAKSASRCTSVLDISKLKNNARQYNYRPLINDSELASALESIESEAKESVIRYIVHHANSVASGFRNYPDYVKWTAAYNDACEDIEEYKSTYDYPQELKDARTLLDETDSEALEYYSEDD